MPAGRLGGKLPVLAKKRERCGVVKGIFAEKGATKKGTKPPPKAEDLAPILLTLQPPGSFALQRNTHSLCASWGPLKWSRHHENAKSKD